MVTANLPTLITQSSSTVLCTAPSAFRYSVFEEVRTTSLPHWAKPVMTENRSRAKEKALALVRALTFFASDRLLGMFFIGSLRLFVLWGHKSLHSLLSATIGSTRAARRAGSQPAPNATATN